MLALSVAGCSDAQALIIDDFTSGAQDLNSGNPSFLDQEVQTSSAIGGYRFLSVALTDGIAAINGAVVPNLGLLDANALSPEALPFAGNVTARWDGQGDAGLGGIDLTDGGSNSLFSLDVALLANADLSEIFLRVIDTGGMSSSLSRDVSDLSILLPNLFPFGALDGNADLTSIDSIQLEISLGGEPSQELLTVQINEFSVVPIPEPGTALLMGLGLAGLGAVGRSQRRASHETA